MADPWAQYQDRVVTFRPGGPRAEVAYIMDASELSTDIPDGLRFAPREPCRADLYDTVAL